MILKARDMLDWEADKVWHLSPSESSTIIFDDGELNMPNVHIHLSWYFWQVTKYYSQVPLTKDLVIGDEPFTDKVARKLMNIVIQSTREFADIDKEDVWKIVYGDIYAKCFGALASRLTAHISGTDGDDVIELLDDPDILEANDGVTVSLDTVDNAYEVIGRVLADKVNKYPHNPIVRAVKYSTVKLNQMLPSFGPRGRVTDVDSEQYRIAVTRGFSRGFTSIADFAKESRSAAKALLYNKDPVATAEYFNRKLQFVVAYINTMHKGDCGTTEYHEFEVPSDDTGKDLLMAMDGMSRVLEGGRVKRLDGTDHSLLGKTLKFRSTLTCDHLPEQGVCETCYGDLAYSIPEGDNPGHVSCATVNDPLTQSIISTKHLDFIVSSMNIWLTKQQSTYFYMKKSTPDMLYLNKVDKSEHIHLRIYKEEAPMLAGVRYVTDPSMMNPTRTAAMAHVEFCHLDDDGLYIKEVEIDMIKRSTPASFSSEFLSYAKQRGWEEDAKRYVIDLDGWDSNKPIFIYPHRHINMGEFGKQVERFIRSTRKAGPDDENKRGFVNMLTRYTDVTRALYDAWYLITSRIPGVHITHIATVLAASRVMDPENYDYSIPGSIYEGCFERHDEIIRYKSLGTAMQYQDHSVNFNNINSFLVKNRSAGNLDDLIHLDEDKYPRHSAS